MKMIMKLGYYYYYYYYYYFDAGAGFWTILMVAVSLVVKAVNIV